MPQPTASDISATDFPPASDAGASHEPTRSASGARVSLTASHQHQHEQELLLGFAVPAPPVATTELTLAAGGAANGEPSHTETPRTLWMGDLDPWLDEAAVVALWWQVLGQHVGVKVIRPRHPHLAAAHAGYCFVEFPSFEAAQQALSLNGQLLPDMAMPSQREYPDNPDNQKKYFRLNWAAGATLLAPLVELPEYSLFVGDLSAATTEAHLLLFFQKLFPHSIRTVRVMTDPVSGKSRCFGFVRFSDKRDRQRALIEMNGAWFGGRPLRVANATPRAGPLFRKDLPDPRLAYPMGQGELMYMGLGQQGAVSPLQGYYASPMMGPEMPLRQFVDPGNTTVFVGGLLADVSDQTLYTLFKPFGAIIQIKLPPGKNCGFVRYSSREEAEDAIASMAGFVIGGRRVRLGWGRISLSNKQFQQHQQHQQHMAQMQMQAAMSLAYDPNSVYTTTGYPPMPGVPVGPPGMFHYMPSLDMPPDYEQGLPVVYGAMYLEASPLVRSRSLEHVMSQNIAEDASGPHSAIEAHENVHEHLADKFDSLSLNAQGDSALPRFNLYGNNEDKNLPSPEASGSRSAYVSDTRSLSPGPDAALGVKAALEKVVTTKTPVNGGLNLKLAEQERESNSN